MKTSLSSRSLFLTSILLFVAGGIASFMHGCTNNHTRMQVDPGYAGMANGNVAVSTNGGTSWTITTKQPDGSAVNAIFAISTKLYAGTANGNLEISSNQGSSWTATTKKPDGSAVKSIFVTASGTIYAGTANGNVEVSTNGGSTWTAVTKKPDGSAVNAIFVTTNGNLYAGTANGNVEISTNKGSSWTAINGKLDGSAVTSIFVTSTAIYTGTADEYVYKSTSLTGGGSWTLYAQTVYSLFVETDSNIYSGTQAGYVFSLTEGLELGFVANSSINSIYFLN